MHLTIRVLGLELLDVHLGSSATADEPDRWDDLGASHVGFVPPPPVPAELDMPDRDYA